MALTIIDKLDQPDARRRAGGNIWVVYLKNADAVKLATVLRAAYSGQHRRQRAAGTGVAGTGAPTPSTGARLATAPVAAPQATTPVAASPSPSTGGFIQADPATNSLIITAPEPLYRQLRNVIDQLDTRRAQVYIETLIVKVDAEKAAEIGVQWQAHLRRPEQRDQLRRRHQPGPARHRQPDRRGQLRSRGPGHAFRSRRG